MHKTSYQPPTPTKPYPEVHVVGPGHSKRLQDENDITPDTPLAWTMSPSLFAAILDSCSWILPSGIHNSSNPFIPPASPRHTLPYVLLIAPPSCMIFALRCPVLS